MTVVELIRLGIVVTLLANTYRNEENMVTFDPLAPFFKMNLFDLLEIKSLKEMKLSNLLLLNALILGAMGITLASIIFGVYALVVYVDNK